MRLTLRGRMVKVPSVGRRRIVIVGIGHSDGCLRSLSIRGQPRGEKRKYEGVGRESIDGMTLVLRVTESAGQRIAAPASAVLEGRGGAASGRWASGPANLCCALRERPCRVLLEA